MDTLNEARTEGKSHGRGQENYTNGDASGNAAQNGTSQHEIAAAIRLLIPPGQVTELRMLNTPQQTVSGYFDDPDKLARAAFEWDRRGSGVYFMPNPVLPALLARAQNRVVLRAKQTTSDKDIERRRFLMVDFDADRPAGISATEPECEAAIARMWECEGWLRSLGFVDLLAAISGNGGHVLTPIDLPNDSDSLILVKRCLAAIGFRFADNVILVDQTVSNAARIWKLYGTTACKGDSTPDRPHRKAFILEAPDQFRPNSKELLALLASFAPEAPKSPPPRSSRTSGTFNLEEWISTHNLDVRGPYPWQEGKKWIFTVCPFNQDHTNSAAYIVQFSNGAIAAGCHHNGCGGNDWHALRALYEPGYTERKKDHHGNGHTSPRPGAASATDQARDEEAEARPEIRITTDIKGMVDAAEEALLDLPGPVLYQRAKLICRIAPAGESPKWLQRPPDAPVISRADTSSLREYSGQSARWVKYDKRAKEWGPALPPTMIFETLASRVSWAFPSLESIICAPTLRPDGVLITKPGYDKETGLYLDLNGVVFPPVPEAPTQDDAKAALDILYAPFADFPFKDECHRSAALAGVMTLLLRFTVAGCVPAFAVRAHAKGTGKGLLVNTIAMISTGRTAPTWTQTLDEAEEAKRLLTIALAGDACMHIDNITMPFGSAKLNSAITSQTVKDRLLGVNNSQEAPWLTVIFASGNNMRLEGDMVRRVIPIDLDPQVEHPEERSGFGHTPLLDWVKKERPTLVVAALTVMKAFFHAGCPKQPNVSEFGSFEQWSNLVRHSLVWAGFPDPCEGRANLEEESDTSYEALATLLQCWADCYPDTQARTLKTIIQDIELRKVSDPSAVDPANEWNALHDALSAYDAKYDGKRLDTKRIGNALRIIEGRVLDGQRLIRKGGDKHAKVALWKREIIA